MSDKIRVGFDPHGADSNGTDSPLVRQIAALASVSLEFRENVEFVVAGRHAEILRELDKHPHGSNIIIEPVSDVFAMDGKVEDYKDRTTTISRLSEMLQRREIDVLFSNGNTTATIYYPAAKCGMLARGVRPCLVTQMPRNLKDVYYLSDAGANKQARPQHLLYNAVLTQLYLQFVKNIPAPRIGLLEGPLADDAKAFFDKVDRFVGIVTPFEAYNDMADVLVTDGFNGNIYLKTVEAAGQSTMVRLKSATGRQKLWASIARRFGLDSILKPHFTRENRRYEKLNALGGRQYTLHPVDDIEQVVRAAAYMKEGYNGRHISVLSNGEEDVKGNKFAQELAKALKQAPIKYVGFVEPSDVLNGKALREGAEITIDGVFTEKKTADLFLDTVESSEKAFLKAVSPLFEFWQFLFNSEGVRERFLQIKNGVMNPNHYNGAPVLGIDGYALVGHGKATQYGTEQGLRFAIAYRKSAFIECCAKDKMQNFVF